MNVYCLKKETLLLCLLFFNISLFSQQKNIEDYKQSLEDISNKYPTNSDTVISIFTQMLNTSDIKNDVEKYGLTILYIGREYKYKKNNVAIAKKMYEESLELAQMNNKCALEINSRLHLVMLYRLLNKNEDRIQGFEDLVESSKNCPQYDNIVYIYTQLGLAYTNKGDMNLAEKNYLKADSALNTQNNVPLNKIHFTYSSIIDFYAKNKNQSQAVFFAKKVANINLKKFKQSNSHDLTVYAYTASIFKSVGEIDSALFYAHFLQRQPIKDFSEVNREAIITSNHLLSELYEQKGDATKALFYERKYSVLLDSLININSLEVSSDKVKALEDELKLQKKQNEVKSQQFITALIGGLAALVLIFAGFFYYDSKKLKKLNTILQEQKQELSSLNEIRTKMFSIVSHDLLSPIGALKNMIDLYQMKMITQKDFDTYTVDLKRNLNAILNNLNNILDWSYAQLKGKKPFIEPLNVHKIIHDQLDLQAEVARQKSIELINDVPLNFEISADFNQFSLIVRNLINNALKYTSQGGKVEIDAFVTEGAKVLEIKDNGIGMSEQKLLQLFNPTGKRANTGNGVGLGLQMVNDFLKANNCTISVKSKENEGSVFTILFPLNEESSKKRTKEIQYN